MSYRTGDTNAPTLFSRATRRTLLVGAGVAMVLGIAVPASASAGTAAKPTPAASSTFVPFVSVPATNTPAQTTFAHITPGHVAPKHTAVQTAHQLPKVLAKAAPKKAAAPKLTLAQLETHGRPTHQVSLKPNASQMANAKAIIQTGEALKLPPRAWVIAVATSMQETHLQELRQPRQEQRPRLARPVPAAAVLRLG